MNRTTVGAGVLPSDRQAHGMGHAIREALVRVGPALLIILWVLAFVFAPMVIMGIYSLWEYENFEMLRIWTIENYTELVTSTIYLRVLWRTIQIAGLTTIFCVLLAYPFAYFLARGVRRWRELLVIMVMIPFWTSFLVRTYAWMSILGEHGVLNETLLQLGLIRQPLQVLYTTTAVIIAATYLFFPFAILTLYSSLEKLGPSTEEAALDLGATPWQAFRRITLPLSAAGIQAAVLFVFVPALGLFVTPALLGGTRATMIGNVQVTIFKNAMNFGLGSSISFVVLALAMLFVAGMGRSVDLDKVYAGGVGDVARAPQAEHHPLRALGIYAVLMYVFLYLPIAFLIIFSVNNSPTASFPWQGFTLKWYQEVIRDPWMINSVRNSLMIACLTALISVVVAAPAAYAMVRFRFPGRNLLKQSLIIPMIIPSIMLGFALLILFTAFGIDLSVVTVLIGHVTYVLPYVFFVVAAQQYGFDKTLEEAAMDLGANRWVTFRRVTLPLMLPGLLAGALFAFTLSLDEFIITFLLTGTLQTLPLFVWGMLRTMVSPTVNAVGTLIVVVAFVVVLAAQFRGRLRRRQGLTAAD
ncbi:MAG TPA: ABC transporter permease subunit [Candidatus Methylomirabilis sp.]|nr:ABC transporter permease subunit [Candidatus Methylomirabilis sp.]HSC70676.1 ABC transporter permease subunit [Candidatus Methylomirabilis sp.]